jgi:hypothetical protein
MMVKYHNSTKIENKVVILCGVSNSLISPSSSTIILHTKKEKKEVIFSGYDGEIREFDTPDDITTFFSIL